MTRAVTGALMTTGPHRGSNQIALLLDRIALDDFAAHLEEPKCPACVPLPIVPPGITQRSALLDLRHPECALLLRQRLDRAAHVLPAQGPISVFIHHNTLHAFEHLPFDDAVCEAAGVFGCCGLGVASVQPSFF